MNAEDRTPASARVWAMVGTVAFHLLLLLAMVAALLVYDPAKEAERQWPPVDDDEILYGGEYVMIGDDAEIAPEQPDNSPASPEEVADAVEGMDLTDGGEATATPPEPAATEEPSPVKVKKKPQPATKPGPTKEELERAERQRAEREAAERVSRRVNFKGSGGDASGAKPGAKNGNSTTGALSGAPGTDLHGRSLESWSKPSGRATGTIRVQVTVNRKGVVTKARYISGTGPVAGDNAARRSCEQAALRSTFSVADNGPAVQTGTITYRFE